VSGPEPRELIPPRDRLGRLIIPGYDGPTICRCGHEDGEQTNLFNDDTQCARCGGLVDPHLKVVDP